jgi:uncharacterized protein (TIGR02147 family)
MNVAAPFIFEYMDYRLYLGDYYAWKKAALPQFSYQVFARKAGFGSKSFLAHVINGKRNLSRDSIYKIGQCIELNGMEMIYFEELVAFSQSKDLKQRSHFFSRLAAHRHATKARFIQENQYEYFSTWYHSTIRELITYFDFHDDYSLLANRVHPRIKAKQARDSVALLLNLGLVKKSGDHYTQIHTAITTGDELKSLVVHNFHLQNLELAGASLSDINPKDRDISCMVLGLSRNGFEAVKRRLQRVRKELAELASKDIGTEKVYHVSMNLFPTTQTAEDKK